MKKKGRKLVGETFIKNANKLFPIVLNKIKNLLKNKK